MTRGRFHLYIVLIFCFSFLIILLCAWDYFISDPKGMRVFFFFKDMAAYILLGFAPIVGYIFTARQIFVQKLEQEWRRVVEVKSDIVGYTFNPDEKDYYSVYSKLSSAIDHMRCVYRNVGEDRFHLGLYPFQTLHDFRKALDIINPRSHKNNPITQKELKISRDIVIDSFQTFRDIFLIEIAPPEPKFAIIGSHMKSMRVKYVSDSTEKIIVKRHKNILKYFGVNSRSPIEQRPR